MPAPLRSRKLSFPLPTPLPKAAITLAMTLAALALDPAETRASSMMRSRQSAAVAVAPLNLTTHMNSADRAVRIRAALLSVHVHVERARGLAPILKDVEAVPISGIVEILQGDTSPIGRSRQRRAGIRLLALAANPDASDELRESARSAAIQLLSRREVSRVFDNLHPATPDACQSPAEDVEALIGKLVDPTMIGSCGWANSVPRLSLRPNVINLNIDLDVTGQTLANAAKGLDPQEWDDCTSLWGQTHLCQLNQDGTPVDDGRGGCVPETNVPVGSDYGGPRRFYEHFVCDRGLCSVELFLDTRVLFPYRSADQYLLWYNNPKRIYGPNVHPDQGDVAMEKRQDAIAIKSHKTFGFDKHLDAAVVYLILKNIETGHYLSELACCHQ